MSEPKVLPPAPPPAETPKRQPVLRIVDDKNAPAVELEAFKKSKDFALGDEFLREHFSEDVVAEHLPSLTKKPHELPEDFAARRQRQILSEIDERLSEPTAYAPDDWVRNILDTNAHIPPRQLSKVIEAKLLTLDVQERVRAEATVREMFAGSPQSKVLTEVGELEAYDQAEAPYMEYYTKTSKEMGPEAKLDQVAFRLFEDKLADVVDPTLAILFTNENRYPGVHTLLTDVTAALQNQGEPASYRNIRKALSERFRNASSAQDRFLIRETFWAVRGAQYENMRIALQQVQRSVIGSPEGRATLHGNFLNPTAEQMATILSETDTSKGGLEQLINDYEGFANTETGKTHEREDIRANLDNLVTNPFDLALKWQERMERAVVEPLKPKEPPMVTGRRFKEGPEPQESYGEPTTYEEPREGGYPESFYGEPALDYTEAAYTEEGAKGQEYVEYRDYAYDDGGEYRETTYADVVDVASLEPLPTPRFTNPGMRAQTERENTPQNLIEQRIRAQEDYIARIKGKYTLGNPDQVVQRALYRLNGRTKNYVDELEETNKTLPPMSEKAKLTVIIPAYNEEGKIEQTLRSWLNQREIATGQPIDPEVIEFLIVVNRPNAIRSFDNTATIIKKLSEDSSLQGFAIHVVEKTFNFPDKETTFAGGDGASINVPPGVRMGQIYKYGADLVILRNLARSNELRKANHLLRTGGADVQGRDPEFVSRAFSWFDQNPQLEQYVSRADYPPAVYQKLPLLHVAQRLNEMMNLQYTNRKSHIGNGTYRAGIYAEGGGFDSGADIREEIDLSQRMRKIMKTREGSVGGVRKRDTVITALDDPRRAVAAILAGKPITQAYGSWTNEAVRKIDLKDILAQPVPPQAQLTAENVQRQVETVFQFYFKQILEQAPGSGESRIQNAYHVTRKYLQRALTVLGIDHYELNYKGTFAADYGKTAAEIAENVHIRIPDIQKLEKLVAEYPTRTRADWINAAFESEEESNQSPKN